MVRSSLASLLCVVALVVSPAASQFSFFDLDSDPGTKLVGTTKECLSDCMSTPNGLCGDGGRTVYTPDATHPNLLAWYTFDDALGLDSSGNANHATSPPPGVGPGHDAHGQSAYFDGNSGFKMPHSEDYSKLRSMTVSMWIYLLSDSTDSWRVVFRKGDTDTELTPALLLFPDSRKLHLRVSTTDPQKNGLDTQTAIPLRRWTHIAVVVHYNVVSMYINGMKDSEGIVSGEVEWNSGAFHLGKDSMLPGTGMFADNFKVYEGALSEQDIQAEASLALPGLGPNFVRLGCKECDMNVAIERCASNGGYHLCRSIELQGGALMVARAMGYLDLSSEHWAAEDAATDVNLEKLGLCCAD